VVAEVKEKSRTLQLSNSSYDSEQAGEITFSGLDETIPYYGNLHIDEGTKNLILNLLRSIRSVVPAVPPPEPGKAEELPVDQDLDHINKVLILARQHSEELEGVFNPDELMRYSKYASDYQDIMDQLESTLQKLETCRNSALNFASGMAEMVEGHIHMITPPGKNSGNRKKEKNIQLNREGIILKVV
jgi:hypothetical protein